MPSGQRTVEFGNGGFAVRPIKRILKSESMTGILCWLASLYIRLIKVTGNWQVIGGEIPERFWSEGRPFIFAFWHGRLLLMPSCWDQGRTIYMLTSQHGDGQLIGRMAAYFGVKMAEGSSSRGGAKGLRTMVKAVKNGDCVGITPDGPRGPRMRASEGVISVARLSGAPIIPASLGSSHGRCLSSWDRFLVAWPFGRRVLVWGEPIYVDRDISAEGKETARRQVEDVLIALTNEADRLTGRKMVEPAAAKSEGGGL